MGSAIPNPPGSYFTPNLGFAMSTLPGIWATDHAAQPAANLIVASLATAASTATITTLGIFIGAAGDTAGTGVNGLAIYSAAGSLLAATGDMTTQFSTGAGFFEGTLTAAVRILAQTNYYLAYQHNFTGTSPYTPSSDSPPGYWPLVNGSYPHSELSATSWLTTITPSGTGRNWNYITAR
jgi:hypothetical protein